MTIACPPPHARVAGRRLLWFHVAGVAALIASVAVAAIGVELGDLPVGPLLPLTVLGISVFLVVAFATKVVIDEERLTYYHHELAILAAAAVLLHATGQPVLAYLDVVVAGVGAFLVCGRVGCLLVGCCHGRPARWGLVYSRAHAEAGFPASHVGVPLVPVQLIESTAVTAIVGTTLWLKAHGAADGTALATAVVGYAGVRFTLEFLRGDVRPTKGGLTEAQWTSAVISVVVSTVAIGGQATLPPMVTVGALTVVVIAVARVTTHRGSRRDRRTFRSPRHCAQLLAFVRDQPPAGGVVSIAATSLGVAVSASSTNGRSHWGISWPGHDLVDSDAAWVARLIASAGEVEGVPTVQRVHGVVHVIARPVGEVERASLEAISMPTVARQPVPIP